MATYTVGSGGSYATLQSCLVSGVLSAGDTVQILAGYSQVEQVGAGVTWPNNLIVQGDASDPSSAVIEWDNPTASTFSNTLYIGSNSSGVTFRGLTINYTGAASSYTVAYSGGWAGHSGIVFEDCVINASGTHAMRVVGNNLVVKRCKIDGSSNTTSQATSAIYASRLDITVESSLILNFTGYNILGDACNVSNCTVYLDKDPSLIASNSWLVFLGSGSSVSNCIIQSTNNAQYTRGIYANGPSTGTITNCIVSGFWNDATAAGMTFVNVTTTAAVGSSPVLADPAGGDFYPANPGIALYAGDALYAPSGGDLTRRSFNSLPSIGALEYVPPAPPDVSTVSGNFVTPPPNVTSVASISIGHTLSAPSLTKDIYLGYPAMGNVVSFVSDFTSSRSAGNRLWLASGTLGSSGSEYIPIYDIKADVSNCLRTNTNRASLCAVFVDSVSKRLVWDQDNPNDAASGLPTKVTYYIATSSGRLVPVYYYDQAALVYAKLTCPNAASASTSNDIIGANTGTATEINTSRSGCFVNVPLQE